MKHTYSVRKQDLTFVLIKDGFDAACPFQPSIVGQNAEGGLNIMRIACSTHCALATIEEEEVYDITTNQPFPSGDLITKTFYKTTCGSCERKHQVSLNVNELKAI
jgi:hypothetical protein